MGNIKGFGELTEEQIRYYEDTYNIVLPKDYKEFLKENNGGKPKEGYLIKEIPETEEEIMMGVLYGKTEDRVYDLDYWNKEYGNELGEGSIIIGNEYGGGLFVLVTDEERIGVYMWDSSGDMESTTDDNNMYKLGSNFTEFIKGFEKEL